MDTLDWIARGSGVSFGLLLLALGATRLNPAGGAGDISPVWQVLLAIAGGIWAVTLIADWLFPVTTTVYIANASAGSYDVRLADGSETCLGAKLYWGRSWRLWPPNSLAVLEVGSGRIERFQIGKGTWFINVSSVPVSADMHDNATDSIDFDALLALKPEVVHLSNSIGRPFRLFSQLPMDRIYTPDGDVTQSWSSGRCAGVKSGWTEAMAGGSG